MVRADITVLLVQVDEGWELHSRLHRKTVVFDAYADAYNEGMRWLRRDGGRILMHSSARKCVFDLMGNAIEPLAKY